ncbi:MAG: sortase [bacterium]
MYTQAYQVKTVRLGEGDIRLFLKEAPRLSNERAKLFVLSFLFVLLVPVVAYILLNYSALLALYSQPSLSETPVVNIQSIAVNASSDPVQPVANPTPWPAPTITDNSLSAPALNIAAPVAWDTAFDNDKIQSLLPNSLVHFQGTAKPGQTGYVVITGHSSNYPWIKGQFNSVFAPLRKAATGMQITLNYDNHEYTYQVTKIYEVQPDDIAILNNADGSGLRLITCTPIGTSLRRLVVEGVQISPNPATNQAFVPATFSGTLPATQ